MDINKANLQDLYPLSPMQEKILSDVLSQPDGHAYFEQMCYTLSGVLNIQLFEQSWQILMDRHDALRTVFVSKKKTQLLQMVLKKRQVQFIFSDIQAYSNQEQQQMIDTFCQQDRMRGFDLSKDVLMRLHVFQRQASHYQMIWSIHHIIIDGWCFGIIFQELLTLYESLLQGRSLNLLPAPRYNQYIKWLNAQNSVNSQTFWQTYLQGFEKVCGLYARTQTNKTCVEQQRYKISLSEQHSIALNAFAHSQAITLNTLIQTAWAILLSCHNDTDDVLFGVIVSGRPADIPQVENILGLFVNDIPVRIQLNQEATLENLLLQVQKQALLAKPHHHTSWVAIQEKLGLTPALINHVLVFENTPSLFTQTETTLSIEFISMLEHLYHDVMLLINPDRQISVTFAYNTAIFSSLEIQRVAEQLESILINFLNHPNQCIKNLGS